MLPLSSQVLQRLNVFAHNDIDSAAEAMDDVSLHPYHLDPVNIYVYNLDPYIILMFITPDAPEKDFHGS